MITKIILCHYVGGVKTVQFFVDYDYAAHVVDR